LPTLVVALSYDHANPRIPTAVSGIPLPTDPDAAGFAPLPRRETLTSQLARTLGERIMAGEYAAGAKLPTEQELVEAFGVSRTVVREAISLLKAGGLVTTRQGVGVFVATGGAARPFRVEEARLDVLREVIAVVELRIGVEAEAASLAAQRRTDADIAALVAATEDLDRCIREGRDAIAADLTFHRTIAEATGNRHFTNLFNYLGALVIPRTRVQTFQFFPTSPQDYLTRINAEHRMILDAIVRGDADAARAAMRLHLTGSRERLRAAAVRQEA
jgi:GntR family transcriptional regulator, transcriptional repressor for pyruvate dehydrogenase complex